MGYYDLGVVIRSIRISTEYDNAIRNEAKKQGLSINSYINKIIERHLNCYKLINRFPCLIIPNEVIVGLINQLSDEDIFKQGNNAGSFLPKHTLFLKNLSLTLENVIKSMRILNSQNSNWYHFERQDENGSIKLLLRHQLGKKWSIYLNGYYSALFNEILKLPVKIIEGKRSIMIEIPKPIIRNNGDKQVNPISINS